MCFLCVQQFIQNGVVTPAGDCFCFPPEAGPQPVQQHALHTRDESPQTALPQVAAPSFTSTVLYVCSATIFSAGCKLKTKTVK